MPDNVLLRKAQIIERCLHRIEEVYAGDERNLREDFTKQESILLNLERAAQAAIDAGSRMMSLRGLGVARESREVFGVLKEHGLIPAELAASLMAMVGFRNIAVHNYQDLKLDIVQGILEQKLDDLRRFATVAIQFS